MREREKKDTKITIANYQRPGWEYKHLSIGVYPVGYTPLLQHLVIELDHTGNGAREGEKKGFPLRLDIEISFFFSFTFSPFQLLFITGVNDFY